MNKAAKHNPDNLIPRVKPPYSRSKEQVWDAISATITEPNNDEKIVTFNLRKSYLSFAIAAMVTILIGVPMFMRFYTKTINVAAGEHAQIVLPDGSRVKINAGSELNFHPYWWMLSREVKLSGEAYFEVEKGEKFVVSSEYGQTTVLGTTFNIYARENSYNVACLSGSVKVSDYNAYVVLKPMQKAVLTSSNTIEVKDSVSVKQVLSWTNNEFIYTGEHLSRVVSDISLQYGINIEFAKDITLSDLSYSGNFNRSLSAEKVLYFVFKPFGLKSVKKADGEYLIEYEN